MYAAKPVEGQLAMHADQRVILHGITWSEYEVILAVRGERPGVRMTYLEGELEIMSPSRFHEGIKKTLARLLEAYANEKRIKINGYGSMTMRSAPRERGAEPDECYVLGGIPKDTADIAIEVIWTSGGLDKLEVYRGLGVREVWIWEEGRIEVHILRGDRYARAERSEALPDIHLDLLGRIAEEYEDQTEAVWQYIAALRA